MKQRILKKILPNIATMWVAKDVFSTSLCWSSARAGLAKINRESALITMAMLNAVCAEFLSPNRSRQEARSSKRILPLVNYLFAPQYRSAAIEALRQSTGPFVPIAPQAAIAMTEACMRYCSVDGVRFEQPWQCPEFAHILLSFQDATTGDAVKNGPINFAALTEEQFADFARNYQTANFNSDLLMLMRRHYLMFEAPAESGHTKAQLGITAAEWFTRVSGIDPRHYRMLQLVALSHSRDFDFDAPDLTKLVYDLGAALGRMLPSVADAYRRLHLLAVVEDHPSGPEARDWSEAIFNAHYVRRRPTLHLNADRYLCLHRQLLAERFFGATVHVLADLVVTHSPSGWPTEVSKRTLQVRTEMGVIFEDYVQRLAQILFQQAKPTFRFNLKPAAGGECDALIVIGQTALVIEVVHHPWSIAERSRALPSDFVKHVTDNISKALRMSAAITLRGSLEDDATIKIERAIPIVVMSEAMPINEMTATSFHTELIKVLGEEPFVGTERIYPIQSLSIAQFENLDRLWTLHPSQLIKFLADRAVNPLARFTGDPSLGCKLGKSMNLRSIDDEAHADLQKCGSRLFIE
jgi:hypothetical protein